MMLFNNLNYSHFWYVSTMTSYMIIVRGNEQDPTNPVTKSLGNLWYERFDIVYSTDWCSVCHFDVAQREPRVHYYHAKPRYESRIVIRLPFAHRRPEGRKRHRGSITEGNKESRNRIESNRCFRPAQCDGFDATTEYPFIFFYSPTHGSSCDI